MSRHIPEPMRSSASDVLEAAISEREGAYQMEAAAPLSTHNERHRAAAEREISRLHRRRAWVARLDRKETA